ncbi:hypothetical protein HPP92_004183 [Vanilla planifolia]|uniref:Protein kinase domain-containing protein n=1 Tax=Vanilla planifolia TaxID=51239 RepID=A0A835RKM1_VANPL|nr:hypothetical protein HPP92_004183 [Vanilla planifolia]
MVIWKTRSAVFHSVCIFFKPIEANQPTTSWYLQIIHWGIKHTSKTVFLCLLRTSSSLPSPTLEYNEILFTPMSSPLLLPSLLSPILFLILVFSAPLSSASSLSTIAIAEVHNQTLVCALLPSVADGPYGLNCTAVPSGKSRSYPARGGILYSAITAGNGFLCALASPPSNYSLSTMRWWDFDRDHAPSKRVYKGPFLSALTASSTHVCGLIGDSGKPNCWRWPELSLPPDLKFTSISVGGDFVCGISMSTEVRCFGNNATRVVDSEPKGEFEMVAAGTRHACAVSVSGDMTCWGTGAPLNSLADVSSMALGEGTTCVIRVNGTITCFGDGNKLPLGFETAQFMELEARGRTFCGVLLVNYSLLCWGGDVFHSKPIVFERVLPGSCSSTSICRCGVLPGSGNTCGNGRAICKTCPETSPPQPAPATAAAGGGSRRRRMLFILLGAIGFGIGCVASACYLIFRSKNRGRIHDSGRLPLPPAATGADREPSIDTALSAFFSKAPGSAVEEYHMADLFDATDGFAEMHKIGSGGFGSVYRARLADGRVVAIKRAKPPPSPPPATTAARLTPTTSTSRSSAAAAEEEAAFLAELGLLSRVNHKNLVRLHGFCREGVELILVYEFVARGSLEAHLRGGGASTPDSPLESWAGRIRVALDAARGIEYLHCYAVPAIIHRDIKSSNILLDERWTAKVSDFGLSLLKPREGEAVEEDDEEEAAAGTVGYMDPEYYRLRHLTAKSDVYSFGVVLLELLTGCRAVERDEESGTPRNLVEEVVPRIEADEVHCLLDGRLPPPTPCEIEAVMYVGYLAADCVSALGSDRPTMTEVVAGLERAVSTCADHNQPPGSAAPLGLSRSSTGARSE